MRTSGIRIPMNWQAISFDWNQVRAFLATAEEGSLSAAARALGQTQPTLSRQITALEDALGVTLFQRGHRSTDLTQSGIELLEHVRAMGEAASRISLTASGQASTVDGQVTITSTDTMAAVFLPKILRKLREQAPNISIEIIAASEIRDLRKREADLKISEDTLNLNETTAVTNTWDNYSKLNNTSENNVDEKPLTKEDMLKEKFNILRKLETLERKGVQLTKKYSMESSLNEMKGEYENIVAEKERKNSVKFQGKVLTALITGIEFLNGKFDPFDLKLDGWSEQINENLEDYDEIFTELFEKYRSKTTMSPEIKLIFQLAASGMMIHMTNTMFKSAMPGMDDIMRQNPDLMQQFTSAAMNSMNQTNPGVSNFMNEFSNNKPSGSNFMRQNPPVPPPPQQNTKVPQQNQVRKEMNGPSNLGDLLSGIKKKPRQADEQSINNSSVVSLEDLNELEKTIPKSNKNKKKIKNTISLDI